MSGGESTERSALIVIDMLNPYDHEDADALTDSVEAILQPVSSLVARARDNDAEVVYVNDNYGDWSASKDDLIEGAMGGTRPDLVEPVLPPGGVSFMSQTSHRPPSR